MRCHTIGCTIKNADFGLKSDSDRYCRKHKTSEMVRLIGKKCVDCDKTPKFGLKGGKPNYCSDHKTTEMVSLTGSKCEKCDKPPRYNIKGGKAKFCGDHKTKDMIDLTKKRCEKCDTKPSFGLQGGQVQFCFKHKTIEMIDLVNKKCKFDSCNKQPTFGIKGNRALFCIDHKTNDMVDVNGKKCEKCDINPSFGNKNEKARFCLAHKEPNMINVENKKCKFNLCEKIPTFGKKGERATHCKEHKEDNMVDVLNKQCSNDNCTKRPSFDIKGGNGKFCFEHKTDVMVDVRHRKCIECDQRDHYGKPGKKTTHCATHKTIGMIRNSNSKCKSPKCKESAIYGKNFNPTYCETHKNDDDINFVERECVSCNLIMILDDNNKCEYCNPESFKSIRLIKQNALMNYLDANGLKGESTDKIVNGGSCGKERPDRVYDFGDKIVILECDEYQHKNMQCVCEQTRMVNLGQSYGGIPVYFIRWNPDDYKQVNTTVKPDTILQRHKLVKDFIKDIKGNKLKLPVALVSAFYMYYDGWERLNNENWEIITALEHNEI